MLERTELMMHQREPKCDASGLVVVVLYPLCRAEQKACGCFCKGQEFALPCEILLLWHVFCCPLQLPFK